jgi:primosomal protein N' (replication factor Y)
MKYVNVAINLAVKNLFKQFIYAIPENMDFLREGWRVVVPFGRKTVEGFVVGPKISKDEAKTYCDLDKIKKIIEVLDEEPWFDDDMLKLANWISNYYMCTKAEALRLFIPGKSGLKKGKENSYSKKITEKTVYAYGITEVGKIELDKDNKRIKAQNAALRLLKNKSNDESKVLTGIELKNMKVSNATINKLLEKKWVYRVNSRVLRNSYSGEIEKEKIHKLSEEQKFAFDRIKKSLTKSENKTFLLQGVTGSGKTEIYLNVVKECIEHGKQAMVLVPEIALTGQTVRRFKAWFGQSIAVVHSKLSQNERADVCYRMKTGEAKVLIGVRSAIFVPFKNLGIIVMDEEHDYAYKQEERPAYHARTVAFVRAKLANIPLVLGSATPDLSSYYHAQTGIYEHLILKNRPNNIKMPEVEIVDMRKELENGNKSVISAKLQENLNEIVENDEQAIILLNRRGYSTFIMCRDCGESLSCKSCAVSLVYHKKENVLRCHYCGNEYPVPKECPKCKSKRIKFFGTGTQKAEDEISNLNENIKAIRMDQDSTSGKFSHEVILNKFRDKEYNVLLGTQMVAKGHDIADVNLVGVLSADSQLNLPDFRAAEKTFSLLTQAAGRAGRGGKRGKVVLQVYDADSDIIKMAANQNYEEFANKELNVRKELEYPPFVQLLKFTILDKNKDNAYKLGQKIVKFINANFNDTDDIITDVLGPFPAIVEKTRDFYRINILVKGKKLSVLKRKIMNSEFRDLKNVYFDVDPISVV